MLTVTAVRYTYIHSGFVLYVVLVTGSTVALWLLRMGSTSWVAVAHASLQRDLPEFAIHFTGQSHTMQIVAHAQLHMRNSHQRALPVSAHTSQDNHTRALPPLVGGQICFDQLSRLSG